MSSLTQEVLSRSATEMARLIRERALSSAELMTLHIRQIEEVNPSLNAVVEPLFDSAMASAKEADRKLATGQTVGPLHGVPFSIKDSIDVTGTRTTAGTLGRKAAQVAAVDATLVARLREAGAIPIAKTNLPDLLFAYESDNDLFGRTNNPYDLARTAGGSSGGESALIAACGSALGLGSDAAGSVRVPAAFCGIASIKPTSGRLPRTGHVPPAGGWVEHLWQIGPMARRVGDLQLAMELLAHPDGDDFTSPPVPFAVSNAAITGKIAWFSTLPSHPASPAVAAEVERAAAMLQSAGLQLEHAIPDGLEEAFDIEMGLIGADGCAGLDTYASAQGTHELHRLTRLGFVDRLRNRKCDLASFGQLWARWDDYRARMTRFFAKYDTLLCPVYSKVALPHGESVTEENFPGFVYTMAWNVAGLPAATVRCGESEGLPVNVQVVAGRWQDSKALSICRLLEEHTGGWKPSPLFSRNEDE